MSQCYSFSISAKKFWLVVVPLLLILAAAGSLMGFLLIDKVVMPGVTNLNNKGEVKVPAITGLSYKEASQKLYDLGLRIIVGEKEYDAVVPNESIISQEPLAGETVKKGRHIYVVQSKGNEVDTLPKVKELLEGPAKSMLRKAGFYEITVKSKFSDKIEQNRVIGTKPDGGTVTSRAAEVVLLVSKGEKPTHATVPSLVGEMLSVARTRLDSAGLLVGKIEYKKSSVMGPGQIISQDVAPGSSVKLERKVGLVVSTAP